MWLSLLFAFLLVAILCAGGLGFCYGLWQYRTAIWAMLKTIATRKRRAMPTPAPETSAPPGQPQGILAVYTSVRQWRMRRYLRSDPALAIDVLRQSPETAALAVRTLYAMEARGEAPKRETFVYPQLTFGGGIQPLQRTLPKLAPAALRAFGEQPPARRALNAITDPLVNMTWQIGLVRPVGAKLTEKVPDATKDQQERIVAATHMFKRPNNELTWRPFLEMLVEDLLSFGASPFENAENTSDDRPLFLWPVDAQSIRMNVGWQPGSTDYHYSQARGYWYNAAGTTNDVCLADDELCYPRLNPRTHTPFGLGYLEVAFTTINSFMGSFEYSTRRASNNTPNFGIFLGENVTIDQVRTWQHYWENEIEGYGKVPILGGGRQPSVFSMRGTGQDELFLNWQEFLIRVIAMSFGISPMKLGLERDVNRSTAQVQSSDDWATIAPIANIISDALTHWVLWNRLGWDDLEFTWIIKTADELKQAEIFTEQWNADCITVDELRQAYERPPLDDEMGQHTKSAYQALFKLPRNPQRIQDDDSTIVTPFDDEARADTLTPHERAFLRELVTQKRHERYGLQAVAT